ERPDIELAETFFNSVIRKAYPGMSSDEELMYLMEGHSSCEIFSTAELLNSYPSSMGLDPIIRKILDDYDFGAPFMDKEADIQFLIQSVKEVILTRYNPGPETTTQILKSVFY
ncbi:MAG TPA: bifunctional isocitrate dehydrogenase kinase/phosphatase, partial [Algoriphagus sp.]|nr:bifunctional isocitrate dehydrogenase kinase/phosphatase [Algoriphagus sp.]